MGNLVEVARFSDPEEAFCARGYLLSLGIDSIIHNEFHLNMEPYLRIALGGYGLLIVDDREEEARAAFNDLDSAWISEDGVDEVYSSRKNWFWLPMMALLFLPPFLPRVRSYRDVLLQAPVLVAMYIWLGLYIIFLFQ